MSAGCPAVPVAVNVAPLWSLAPLLQLIVGATASIVALIGFFAQEQLIVGLGETTNVPLHATCLATPLQVADTDMLLLEYVVAVVGLSQFGPPTHVRLVSSSSSPSQRTVGLFIA